MGTHPRPAGPADALSTRLRSETAELHRAAEQRPFMATFFRGELSRGAYVDWLARQWHVYGALERELLAIAPDALGHGLVPKFLHRTERIGADLRFLTDGAWRPGEPTPATAAYVERVQRNADFPPGLVAHAWLRYLGNVGGRDVLRRLVATSVGAVEGQRDGLAFTDYAEVGDEVGPFFGSFHANLDALALDEVERDRVVAEARAGFGHNIALTDELAGDHDLIA